MPWDVTYANTVNAANTRFANQQLDYAARKVLAEQDFGMGAYADAATNPYSRAALLRASYNTAVRGTRNSAGQQLYSGSYELGQRGNEADYAKSYDQLTREYLGTRADLDRQEREDREAREEKKAEAGWDRLQRASEEEPESDPVKEAVRKRRQKKGKQGGRKGRK